MSPLPKQFLWGAGTSSHQVEGGTHNDWSEWEEKNAPRLARQAHKKWTQWQQEKFPEMFDEKNYISGRACDHYNRYEEDFDIAQRLGHNAHRLSLEWSRIEPKKGKFDEKELNHYKNVIAALKKRGLEPFVTLWHFTLPVWVRDIGGWENKETVDYFTRYTDTCLQSMRNVKFWITLNEPDDIYAVFSYLKGVWPPQKRNPLKTFSVIKNLIRAHKEAYKIIHKHNPSAMVGFANNVVFYEASKDCFINKALAFLADYFWNCWFLNRTITYNDFLGCNYYHHNVVNYGFNKNEDVKTSDIGWEISPRGIYYTLKNLKKYDLPIYITENGLADADDARRGQYIANTLMQVRRAIEDGVDVRGYFHWSLLDNFEWDKGFWPRFGLVEIDYKTMKRTVRKSAEGYKTIIENASAR